MSQIAVPNSLVSSTWTGTAAGLADAYDGTYLESPGTPDDTSTFLIQLSSIADPIVHTAHQITIRPVLYPTDGDPLRLVLRLENSGDSSTVATWTVTAPSTIADTILALSEAQASSIVSYSALQIRGYAEPASSVYFVWSAVPGATSYVLQIRPETSLTYDTHNADVGNVLQHSVALSAGTYYSRVVPQGAGSATAEQTVVVT